MLVTLQYIAGMQIFLPLFLLHRNELQEKMYRYVGYMLTALNMGIGVYHFFTS